MTWCRHRGWIVGYKQDGRFIRSVLWWEKGIQLRMFARGSDYSGGPLTPTRHGAVKYSPVLVQIHLYESVLPSFTCTG